MLVLSRQRDQSVLIGNDIRVTVMEVRDEIVRLGFEVPHHMSLHREEVYQAIQCDQQQAVSEPPDESSLLHARRLEVAPPPVRIRPATVADLDAINRIYNHYVIASTCTYQEEPSTPQERAAWFAEHDAKHPVTVAEREGEVVGWGALSRFHARSAYRRTVENSLYVRHDCRRQRIGEALLADLLERGHAAGHHAVLALIDAEQRGSIALHEKFGFLEVGRLREVGFKSDRWLDVVYLQRML